MLSEQLIAELAKSVTPLHLAVAKIGALSLREAGEIVCGGKTSMTPHRKAVTCMAVRFAGLSLVKIGKRDPFVARPGVFPSK